MTDAKGGSARAADSVRGWHSTQWLVVVIALLGAAVLYKGFNNDRKIRAITDDQLRQTVAYEDRAFCEKFGMHAGTPQFVACGEELGIIRQKQTDRDWAAAQGLF